MALSSHGHLYLYIPFFLLASGCVLLRAHKMSLSLGAAVKMVLTPAFVRMRLIWGAISGIYLMQANGLYSSSVVISHLNGSSSKRF